MRRFLMAIAALAFAAPLSAGCGPDPRALEPGLREALRDLAKAVVANDKDKIATYFLPASGFINDPVGAKTVDTPEGRASAIEANRRWIRRLFKDSGIEKDTDVDTFLRALKIGISGRNANILFEIAAEDRRAAEIVTIRMQQMEPGWRIWQYERELKSMR